MKPWLERNHEEAHLLNPAFCCATITSACAGFSHSRNETMPFPLIYMVLPIILHKHTRENLPSTIRTSIPAWLLEHSDARLGFHSRLMALQPHTREAIWYGLTFGWIVVNNAGCIRCDISNSFLNSSINSLDGEARECVSRSKFLGRWFNTSASTETTMALWGIRP